MYARPGLSGSRYPGPYRTSLLYNAYGLDGQPGLRDLPAGMPGNYMPTAAERARAQDWATQNGYGTVGTPWNDQGDGSGVFTVPTSGGGGNVRFGWGRGWFAGFPQPGGGSAGAGSAAAAAGAQAAGPVSVVTQPAAVIQAALPAPAVAPPVGPAAAVTATVVQADGSQALVPALLQTSAPAAVAPAAGGFNFQDFVTALLKAPAMQPLEAGAASAAAPYAPQVAGSLATAWLKAHQTQLLLGGAVAVGGFVLYKALR